MKTFIWIVAIVLGIAGIIHFVNEHIESYQIRGVCKKTLITYDHRAEHTDYTVIIQYENGEVEDIQMIDGKAFFSYKEGETYYFTRTRWIWDKNKK